MSTDMVSSEHIVTGTFARFITVKEDYRQYPSYP
ncbi:YIEGIA family protein [Polycladospora coralii]|nr:YIEGIA family protein [Polycladospora coralii]